MLDHVRVQRFVREKKSEGFVALALDETDCAVREKVGNVAFDSSGRAVLVEIGIGRFALPLHADPIVESRPLSLIVPHMPLAEKSRLVAGRLETLRKRLELVRPRAPIGVVEDAVRMHKLPRQNASPTGRAKRRRRERIQKPSAFPSDPIDMRRLDEWMPISRNIVPPKIVNENDNKIRPSPRRLGTGWSAGTKSEKNPDKNKPFHGPPYTLQGERKATHHDTEC